MLDIFNIADVFIDIGDRENSSYFLVVVFPLAAVAGVLSDVHNIRNPLLWFFLAASGTVFLIGCFALFFEIDRSLGLFLEIFSSALIVISGIATGILEYKKKKDKKVKLEVRQKTLKLSNVLVRDVF
jgi:hypothetical protein